MPEEPDAKDFGAMWRDQPEEKLAVNLEQLANRRTQELYASTRSEIMMSIGSALFFVVVMAWRFGSEDRLQQLGFLAAVVWVLISLYRFRDWIWRRARAQDALAMTGLEYYRKELERRRDHLRNAWLWHGPLLLACAIFVATVIDKTAPGRLRDVVPVFILLAVWTGFGIRRRLRQAKELQREIDDISLMEQKQR